MSLVRTTVAFGAGELILAYGATELANGAVPTTVVVSVSLLAIFVIGVALGDLHAGAQR
ncbi:hypothetical protein ACFPYI_14750 [Halomarina salina]|uniref:Uncharacterized protein n=1 Tax=Halomarina salina TaxID=1872699 RepID=A0ABD5RQT2_9EURY|nr:hypothetical protein [Halomarina salina]